MTLWTAFFLVMFTLNALAAAFAPHIGPQLCFAFAAALSAFFAGYFCAPSSRSEPEYDDAIAALRMARRHIVHHHASHVVQVPGQFCPVCHHEDDSEPEMDEIARVLAAAEKEGK